VMDMHAFKSRIEASEQARQALEADRDAWKQRAWAAEQRCAALTEAIQQAMALTGTSTAHYHVLAAAQPSGVSG